MSTEYTDTLKRIKAAEDAGNMEVSERRKALEAELHQLEQETDSSIEASKRDADAFVAGEVEKARRAAQADADTLLASTSKQAEAIASKKLEKKELRKIIESVILSEFEER